MTDKDITDELELADEVAPKGDPGSVITRLRELRESFNDESTIDIEVPGYRGELVARYAALPWDFIRTLALRGERGKRNPGIAPTLAADGLANAVTGFYFRDGEGALAPVTWQGDVVDKYDRALATVLGIEGAESVREIVKAVFPDEFALVAHYGELMEWQAERDDGDEEVLAAAKVDDVVHPTLR